MREMRAAMRCDEAMRCDGTSAADSDAMHGAEICWRAREGLHDAELLGCVAAAAEELKAFGRLERDEGKTYPKKLTEAHLQYVSAIDATGETSFDVVLIDGRAHASAAIKAAGYATASTVVLVNDWPKKFETLVKRFYTLVATVGASGRECDKGERACLAVLAVKGKYADKATHDRHVERFKNFMRSPVNF